MHRQNRILGYSLAVGGLIEGRDTAPFIPSCVLSVDWKSTYRRVTSSGTSESESFVE